MGTLYEMMAVLLAEYLSYKAAADKSAHVAERAGAVYDRYLGPIDLPIPDGIEESIVDPAGRAAFVAVIRALHNAVLLRSDNGRPISWPEVPEPAEDSP